MAPNRRTVIIFGAGASVEYGIPATLPLTKLVESDVLSDSFVQKQGGDRAYKSIKRRLAHYLNDPNSVNFEQIYHCAHELIYMRTPISGAVDEYRPILAPFLKGPNLPEDGLNALVDKMIKAIYEAASTACDSPSVPLSPLADFLSSLASSSVLRLYTTNYDDFVLQARNDLYTGYRPTGSTEVEFDEDGFWANWNSPSVFYLHGSVHMSYTHGRPSRRFADLVWFDDRKEALKSAAFSGSGQRRMDGSEIRRAPIITGLDKLSRIQQRPLPQFYAALTRDLMEADCVYVVGAGLGDLHLNSLLADIRARNNPAPIIFVDWWKGGFPLSLPSRKEIEMFHALRIFIGGSAPPPSQVGPWLVSDDRTSAVWAHGFQAFLQDPDSHSAARALLSPKLWT